MSSDEDTRPPVDAAAATPPGTRWHVEVVESSGSTNADVAARFRAGEPEGLALVAEHQSAGRGRLGREWVTPPRAGLTVSFLVVPTSVPVERWSWLPLLTGVAAVDAVRRETEPSTGGSVDVALKWPNDVLLDGRKVGGILLERVERDGVGAAVVGIGLNCTQTQDELPVPEATSIALATGVAVDRTALLRALIESLARRLHQWAAGGDDFADLRGVYRERCSTIGQQVRVSVPGREVLGEAADVDEHGQLVVEDGERQQHLGAGDVVHVRPRSSTP